MHIYYNLSILPVVPRVRQVGLHLQCKTNGIKAPNAYDMQATGQFHEYFTLMEKTKQVPLSVHFNGHFPGEPELAGVY